MVAGANPSTVPTGETTVAPGYKINNDYLYPRLTQPPMLRGLPVTRWPDYLNGPFGSFGLVRGWLYPCDVDKESFIKASTSTDPDEQQENSEVVLAMRQEQLDAGTTPPSEEDLGFALEPVGLPTTPLATGETTVKPKRIRYQEGKQFQFNPFAVSLSIQFNQAAAPAETFVEGGTSSETQVGTASTGIEMFFDRSMEVNAATSGVRNVNGVPIPSIFADIGVQKDLWDVYRIILGGDQDYFAKIGSNLVNINEVFGMKVRDGSVTDMTTRMFDLGTAGASAWGRAVAVYYNPNMVIIGWVTSLAFIYAEFNSNYIPTKAKMDMGLQVLYATSESGADTFVTTDNGTVTPPSTAPTDTPNSNSNSTNPYANNSGQGNNNANNPYHSSYNPTNNNSNPYASNSGQNNSNPYANV